MINLKSISDKIKKEQIITKEASKNLKGGFWGSFVYRGGGQCKLCWKDNSDH